MVSIRSRKILNLLSDSKKEKDYETLNDLSIPFYETTKGTTAFERNNALSRFELETRAHKGEQRSFVSSCTPQYHLRTKNTSNNKKKEIVLRDSKVSSSTSDIENYESSSEEYVPSTSGSESDEPEDDQEYNEISKIRTKSTISLSSKDDVIGVNDIPDNNYIPRADHIPDEDNILYDNILDENNILDDNIPDDDDIPDDDNSRDDNDIRADNIIPDTTQVEANDLSGIEISTAYKNKSGKTLRNKVHACYYCNKTLSNNMARHFERVHLSETEVARIVAMPKGSRKRREAFEFLIRAGDFYHNCNVLSTKQGKLLLARRSQNNQTYHYKDYGPCPQCLGFFVRKYLWHHQKNGCSTTKPIGSNPPKKGILNESAALLFQIIGKPVATDFREKIVDSMRTDLIAQTCREDSLILALGAFLFEKYGLSQTELIRQSMRQLARLKCEFQKESGNRLDLKDFLVPNKFDIVVTTTKSLCATQYNNNNKRNEFGIPSLALKIGYLLRKCVAIEKGLALKKADFKTSKLLNAFLQLLDMEWSTRISSNALLTLRNRKINCKQLLPLTTDLLKLSKYLDTEMENLRKKVLESCNKYVWSRLASVTLSRIILFNKRRSGEASRMTIENYSTRPLPSEQGTEVLKDTLTSVEKLLVERLTVVEIVGKRNRIVPVILTNVTKDCIDILLKTRKAGDVSTENPYVFARSNVSQLNSHMRGHDCLRNECSNAGLSSPENITSTKLRKYIATVCQLFDLKEHECDWLARHLGHDIRVHRDFYRMHESTIEVAKVSRLLLAVDSGKANRFAGKQLEDINITDLPDLDPDSGDDEEMPIYEVDGKMPIDNDEIEKVAEFDVPEQHKEGASPHLRNNSEKTNGTKKKLAAANRKLWSADEKSAVLKHFNSMIKHNTLPGKKECEECIKKYPVLKTRKWTDIKFCCKNHLSRVNKSTKK